MSKKNKIVLLIIIILVLLTIAVAFLLRGTTGDRGHYDLDLNTNQTEETVDEIGNTDKDSKDTDEINEEDKENKDVGTDEKYVPLQLIDFELKDLDGNDFKLSDIYGKNIKLTFWRIGCEPCEEEMEGAAELYAEYQNNEEIEFVLVNTRNTAEEIREHMKENNFNFRVLLDEDKKVTKLYNITSVPTSLFVDKDGKMYRQHFGELKVEDIKELMGIE